MRLTRRGRIVVGLGYALLFAVLVLAAIRGIQSGAPGPIDGCEVDPQGYCVETTR